MAQYSASAWRVADSIDFLVMKHPSVVEMLSRMYHTARQEYPQLTPEGFLQGGDGEVWGLRVRNLIISNREAVWDGLESQLDEVWIGIVVSAMQQLGLVDPPEKRSKAKKEEASA